MKKMIIAGICLVTAAVVYGVADYLKTDKKQLQRMYSDEPLPAAAAKTPAIRVVLPAKADTAKASEKIFTQRRLKKLNLKAYSRAEVEEVYIPADSTKATVMPASAAPVVEPAKKVFVRPQKKADAETTFKKLDASSFSRAPLRKRKPVAVDTVSSATDVLPQQN